MGERGTAGGTTEDHPEDVGLWEGELMPRKIYRTDANQTQIVSVLRYAGVSVISLASVGGGCPDILCGYRGVNYLLEIKDEGKLQENQKEFARKWNGTTHVIHNSVEALQIMGLKVQ